MKTKKEKIIPGIHNYCDRWCERCTFTTHCAIYDQIAEETSKMNDDPDAVFEHVGSYLKDVVELLKKTAQEHGIDLEAVSVETNIKSMQEVDDRPESFSHPLILHYAKYLDDAREFMEKENFRDKAREFAENVNLGISSEDETLGKVKEISDCIEIIQYYIYFIDAKLHRALGGKYDRDYIEGLEDFPKDYEGSAKIALIAMERSISAWYKLYTLVPEYEDIALKYLGILDRTKQMTLEEFPGAMAFKRPGFD